VWCIFQAVALREKLDVASLEEKLDRPLSNEERSRVGVSQLRWFLEQLLRRRLVLSFSNYVPIIGSITICWGQCPIKVWALKQLLSVVELSLDLYCMFTIEMSFLSSSTWTGSSHWGKCYTMNCRYMDSVPAIVPLLDREYRNASIRLHQTIQELRCVPCLFGRSFLAECYRVTWHGWELKAPC
jgi:hypothetical protein